MPHHGMTPHISGSSLSAQARYAAGTREVLECWFENRPIREEYARWPGGERAGMVLAMNPDRDDGERDGQDGDEGDG